MSELNGNAGLGVNRNDNPIIGKDALIKSWALIKHFHWSEFDSPDMKDSGLLMNIEFVALLDQLREKAGLPLHINSGFRTIEHNVEVGGKDESAHTGGVACDIAAPDSGTRYRIIKAACDLNFLRFGIAKSFVHVDAATDKPLKVAWLY